MQPVHVLLVREADMQMSSSGCCGRIEGDAAKWSEEGCVFPERRRIMEEMGALYRDLKERYGDRVQVEIVDPRNLFSYTGLMWKSGRRKRAASKEILSSWMKGFHTCAVVVNGKLAAAGSVPAVEDVAPMVEAEWEMEIR